MLARLAPFLALALPCWLDPSAPAPDKARPRPGSSAPAGRVDFELVSCSLGCVRGPSGFVCTESEVHVNEELRFTFNQPLAPASVNTLTFQLFDLATGRTPPGTFQINADDPATLVYRVALTFDSAGNPVFGLIDGHAYLLRLPGTDQDPLGPYLTSIDGLPNKTRFECTLLAALGVADAVPGRPTAKARVQVVRARDPLTGDPTRLEWAPLDGAVDVWRESPLELRFADLMNPATLANPVTGASTSVHLFLDPDGNVADARDWIPIAGRFTLTLDQARRTTHLFFEPDGGWPPAGTQRPARRVVLQLAATITDLGGNSVLNPGLSSFIPESR
jgi:hypothetical protein